METTYTQELLNETLALMGLWQCLMYDWVENMCLKARCGLKLFMKFGTTLFGFCKKCNPPQNLPLTSGPSLQKRCFFLRMCELLPHVFFYLQHVDLNPFRTRKKDILDLEKDTVLMPDCSELPVSPSAGRALHANLLSGKWSKGNRHGQNLC